MGMNEKQFVSYIRLLLMGLTEVRETMADGEAKEKLQQIIGDLQLSIED